MDKIPSQPEETGKNEVKAFDITPEKPNEKPNEEPKKKSRIESIGEMALRGGERYLDYLSKKDDNETKLKMKELEVQENIMKERLKLQEERLKEMEEKVKKKEKDEEEKKNKVKDGMKEWNKKEKQLIEKYLNEIDFELTKKFLENNLNIINPIDFDYEFKKIFNENLKYNEAIREKHNSIFQSIKDNLKGMQSLNFLVSGCAGTGKSALTNAILKIDEADEGDGIESQTEVIKAFSNPDEVPGIMIYDTVGVEASSQKNNFPQIKKAIEDTFDKYLQVPEKTLHGILYCIKNNEGDKRIEEGEIQFIRELNKIYTDGDILIIVFTQSTNQNSEKRKKQLKEKLNNPGIEIIEVVAKDIPFKIDGKDCVIKKRGLESLVEAMKKKCKKQLVKCNIKQIAKKSLQEKFLKDFRVKSEEITRKINEYDISNNFDEECKYILTNLICELNLSFENLSQLISKIIDNSKKDVKTKILDEYKEIWEIKLEKAFRVINKEYDKLLDDSSIEDDLNDEFNEYFKNNVEADIKKLIIAKASLMFIEKIKTFFGGLICDDIKDEEIEDVVKKNLEHVFNKINNGNNNQ